MYHSRQLLWFIGVNNEVGTPNEACRFAARRDDCSLITITTFFKNTIVVVSHIASQGPRLFGKSIVKQKYLSLWGSI